MEFLKYFKNRNRPVVCIQGLGYVGFAMAIAVANARQSNGDPFYNVIGVDMATPDGYKRVESLNEGKVPFNITDKKLQDALLTAKQQGNLIGTMDEKAYKFASVVVVDVHLDISEENSNLTVDFKGFNKAIQILGNYLKPNALIIVETTVPPGTCERVISPVLNECLEKRGLPAKSILVAHSYERVMPGKDYYDSIINIWRVYSGLTRKAADACEDFLSKVINVDGFPLTRLHSTTASETAKVLENSYRATNIAFIDEWSRFAEAVGIDLFEVIDAIRLRPTHNNIREPGFGVGGYCLTKDPLFAQIAAKTIFNRNELEFFFSTQAVYINNNMPLASLEKVEDMLGGSLMGKSILLLGVSYRPDIGDTRYSPSQIFVENAKNRGAEICCHDPLVQYWSEMNLKIPPELPSPKGRDAIVFAVAHKQYRNLDIPGWLNNANPVILDANNVLTDYQRDYLKKSQINFQTIGRGIH